MGDHTRKFFHISLSQENKFSFEGESGHFKSHIVSKNVELSEIDNYFIIISLIPNISWIIKNKLSTIKKIENRTTLVER